MAEGEIQYGDVYHWGWADKGAPIPDAQKMMFGEDNKASLDGEIVQVEEIGDAFVILTSAGTIYTSGSNKNGLRGINKIDENMKDIELAEVRMDDAIEQLSVGRAHVLIKTKGGFVFAWGANEHGQVGRVESNKEVAEDVDDKEKKLQSPGGGMNPEEKKKEEKLKFVPQPVRVEGIDHIKSVVALEDSSYALTDAGLVYSWGKPKNIGRTCQELELKDEGQGAREMDNSVPQPVIILEKTTRENLKVRFLEKKRRKILAYTYVQRAEDYDVQSEYKGDDRDEADAGKEKTQEQQARDYGSLINCIRSCKMEIMDKLQLFDNTLQKKVLECTSFTANPFQGLLRGEKQEDTSKADIQTKPVHIDFKAGINTLCELAATLKSHVENNVSDTDAVGACSQDPEMKAALTSFYSVVEDSIKLRKLALLAFKMHSYHLRLKCHNFLSTAHHLGSTQGDFAGLLEKVKRALSDCTYISKRFKDLQGPFNKVYDEKANTLVSRTAFHLLDTTYTECEAWKYVNLMTHYAIIFQAGHEDLLSLNDKFGKVGQLYLKLKQAEPHHVYALHQKAAEAEDQCEIMANVRKQTLQVHESIVALKEELCLAGQRKDNIHKTIMCQAYEILIDSSMLRLAYYDLFLSFYETLKVKPVP